MASLNKISQSVDAIFEDGYGTVLIGRAERKGLSPANAKSAFTAYKKFLVLKALTKDYDALKLSPPLPVDTMWHLHVLDTRRYAQDCVQAFGGIIHHDPDGDVNVAARSVRAAATKNALRTAFGDKYDKRAWVWNSPPPTPAKREKPAPRRLTPPPPAVPVGQQLNIRVRDQTGEATYFKVLTSTKLDKVFNAYSQRKGVARDALRFLFDGQRVFGYQTADDIDMDDGDQIDCLLEQQGC
eukprot:CAMPEP_0119263278 /NCGR_PEP_ID=MMETSP1329-20130426/2729_1 /TAXON_ID=114041 /ORGANISM="Genus nov. species nov., Strain RCC1024" /LENGTH=239 /DNA_ID=CAMNT_0007262979 /DNA_START=221 /DNA_END=940 /DNA_ORIENTATION=+